MKFTLLFEGDIPPRRKGSHDEIHKIRCDLSPQLKALWDFPPLADEAKKWLKHADENGGDYAILEKRGGAVFAPLISKRNDLHCELRIKFLRQQAPGQFIADGGDIDNRMKTFLDALSVPPLAQASLFAQFASEEPIYCLMQDDGLVTKLDVETDRLLRPTETRFGLVAIVEVNVRATRLTFANIGVSG
ncbi:hypothetical protein ABIB94_002773 [Bradyrhizobium sp. JR7.2]|uniref:hypothetical protein n=1 Tax=unclassified Bradyrhizobium TaxID=2631580 RepID=UPI003399BA6A